MSDDPNFGDKEFSGVGFPTPLSIPDETVCRRLQIPADGSWQAVTMGALLALTYPENWQQLEGGISREDAAARAADMVQNAYETAEDGCVVSIDTPYWDDESDVDAEETPEMQPWYGEVTNPTAPADELDFVENAIVWGFTGLLALATPELGFAPAILFNTIAPRFIIAMKRADLGEIFRIVVDGQDSVKVDTTPYAAGEIINVPIVADPSLETHSLLIIGTLP